MWCLNGAGMAPEMALVAAPKCTPNGVSNGALTVPLKLKELRQPFGIPQAAIV